MPTTLEINVTHLLCSGQLALQLSAATVQGSCSQCIRLQTLGSRLCCRSSLRCGLLRSSHLPTLVSETNSDLQAVPPGHGGH